MRVAVIIPARDEAGAIATVVHRIPAALQADIIVVDNGSGDGTAAAAAAAGARVVREPRAGYGWACASGVAAAAGSQILVFIDGDGSMDPTEIPRLIQPILAGEADLVCGVRQAAAGSMPWHQRAGNRVIALQLRMLHGLAVTELGPFRAIRTATLAGLALPGSRYGWPAQMLARAARNGARIGQVEVGYQRRIAGRSKVGGSLRGSLLAAWDISGAIVAERLRG